VEVAAGVVVVSVAAEVAAAGKKHSRKKAKAGIFFPTFALHGFKKAN
jgi:hypothetical protein